MIYKDQFEQTSDIVACLKQIHIEKSNHIQEKDVKRFQEIIREVKCSKLYSEWNKIDIQRWSLSIQSQNLKNLSKEILIEILCVLDRAVELDTKHQIREVQMFSLLILLCKNENQGRILQILTGEGKTLIIGCLAVLLCLQGYQVDIVTSSDVLAKREPQKLKQFYSSFNLKCSHNILKEEKKQQEQRKSENGYEMFVEEEEAGQEEIKIDEANIRRDQKKCQFTQKQIDENLEYQKNMKVEVEDGIASCYQNDINIVYGTAHFFQADILKHEFFKKGNRGSRRFDKIIVDEVDSMLVDSRNHRTLIASEQSGFNKIMIIIEKIWIELCLIEHLVNPNTLKMRIVGQYEVAEEDPTAHLARAIFKFLGDKDAPNSFASSMQSCFIDYINHKLPVWVINAVKAKYQFTRDVQYIVKNEEILPLDYSNTGVTQINTQYQDGIHQFLQLKEKVPVTNLNIVTNYSSNINFFRRYQSSLYGLTGTLGSESIRNFLNEIYNVDFLYIPPFKKRLLTELFPYLEDNKNKWLKKIAQDVQWACIEQQRCCLVICQSIRDVNQIYELITVRKLIDSQFIYRYTDSEDSQSEREIQKYTKPGFVIISTNLAGRGCDLKIPEIVEQKGGLHVIVTFIPENSRVLKQAFGRAGRKGQKGSARIVIESNILNQLSQFLIIQDEIDEEHFKQQFTVDLKNQILKKIEQEEQHQISRAKEEVKKIEEYDELFEQFSNKIKNWNINYKDDYLIFRALEFRFGMFLEILNEKQKREPDEIQQIQESDSKSLSYFQADIEKFFLDIELDYKSDQIFIKPEDLLFKSCISLMRQDDSAAGLIQQAKQNDQQNPIPHYQQIILHLQNKEYKKIEPEFKQFREKVDMKIEEHSMLRLSVENSNQIQYQQLQYKLDQEIKLLHNMKQGLIGFNQLSNIKPIQIQQIQIQENQAFNLNLSQFKDLQSKQIQTQQQKYIINKLKYEQIENQKQLINDLKIQLKELEINKKQFDINLSKEDKYLQVYQALSKQLEENIQQLKNIKSKNMINIQFEKASELKSYMTDYNIYFKNITELDQMMAQDGLPLIGIVQTQQQKKKSWLWVVKLGVGVIQIVVGAALSSFTCGSGSLIGINLIIDGCFDVFQSIKAAIYDENIDLVEYFKNKFVSLSLSCILAGQQALVETGQIFKQGAEYAAKNGILNSTKNLLSQEVILGGLKKAGQQAIELNNVQYVYSIIQTKIKQTDIIQETDSLEINELQRQNFQKKLEQIKKSSEIKNQFISIQEKEKKYRIFLEEINDQIKKFTEQEIRLNYIDNLKQLIFFIKPNPKSLNQIENILNKSFLLIDIEKKDKIFENASQILIQTNFNKTTALTNLTPCLKQLLNELFIKVDEQLCTVNTSIFNIILEQAINLYIQKEKKYLDDSVNNYNQKQAQYNQIFQDQKQEYEKELQNVINQQELFQKQNQNIEKRRNELNNMLSNLNQHDQKAVDNYNKQTQILNQQIEKFDDEQNQHQFKVQKIKNMEQDLNQKVNKINNELLNDQNNNKNIQSSFNTQISSLNQKIQDQQTIKRCEDILVRLQVFKSDKITLNMEFQNRSILEQEVDEIFNNCKFSNEIVSYIFSQQFQAEQTKILQLKENIIEQLIEKTNYRVIIPMLQQALNKLISKDITLAESKIKQLAEQINRNQ